MLWARPCWIDRLLDGATTDEPSLLARLEAVPIHRGQYKPPMSPMLRNYSQTSKLVERVVTLVVLEKNGAETRIEAPMPWEAGRPTEIRYTREQFERNIRLALPSLSTSQNEFWSRWLTKPRGTP